MAQSSIKLRIEVPVADLSHDELRDIGRRARQGICGASRLDTVAMVEELMRHRATNALLRRRAKAIKEKP